MKQTFTREEVIRLLDEILTYGNVLMDAITNEHTDIDGETLLEIVENDN